ncbi:MAG: hypothetical protein Q4D93_00960 [Porphyromonas sp.]|nr:hypothetical protein [Porphyromonas sp.]
MNHISYLREVQGHLLIGILLAASVLAIHGTTAQAQGVVSTPITRLGYGILEQPATVAWKGMGGVGIGMSNNKVINLANPAGAAATDSLSFLIDLGASVNMGHYRDEKHSKSTFLGGLDYLALQFPVYKDRIALSAGFIPFSHAGYGLVQEVDIKGEETTSTIVQNFTGSGSLQSAYGGIGVRVWDDFMIGANVRYLFGKLTHTVHTIPSSTILSQTYNVYTLRLASLGLDFGAQYRIRLGSESQDNIILGATYTPQLTIKPELSFNENRNYGSADKPQITERAETMETATPHKIGVGFSWSRADKMIIAGDFSTSLWDSVNNIFVNDGLTLTNSYAGALGVEFLPDRYSRKFADRMYYRGGVNYESNYYKTDLLGQTHKVGVTFGIGMPISSISTDRSSIINLTLGYDRTFSTVQREVSQNILKLSLGITFNETWFRKLKIY